MSKHTPGPWKAGRPDMATIDDNGFESKWIYAGEKYLANASSMDIPDWNEVMANARLIAAAPDLLQELKHLVAIINPCLESSIAIPGLATLNAAKAVIAKAEGV